MSRIVYTQDVAGDFRARLDGRAQPAGGESRVEEAVPRREETDQMAGFKPSGFKSSGFKSSFKPAAPVPTEAEEDLDGEELDDDIDGAPLNDAYDVDGEELNDDVDGAPLDDVDGAPLENVDGEELEMELDGESLEEVPVDTADHPIGADADDVDGAPMPESDGEAP